MQIATGEVATEEIVSESRKQPLKSCSTPVNFPEEVRGGSLSLNVTPVGSPVKYTANVMFTVNEGNEVLGSLNPVRVI